MSSSTDYADLFINLRNLWMKTEGDDDVER